MTRPAAYLAALVALFGVAFVVGGALGGVEASSDEPGAMAMEGEGDAHAAPPGLAVAADGLRLVAPATTLRAGAPTDFAFRVADEHGATVRDFAVEHGKRLHFIVVRRDLTGFQHLHPTQRADGSWSTPLTLRAPGAYRVFADFVPRGGEKTTLGADVLVGGDFAPVALPAPSDRARVDGFDVALSASGETLRFAITRGGRAVDVEPYLGASGHLVALRDGDLAYLHVHPHEDAVAFDAEFPSAGRYRLFLQFKAGGRVHTAAFTKVVA